MSQDSFTQQQSSPPATDDPNRWLDRVRLLLERSVIACHQITAFSKQLQGREQPSPQEQMRFSMLSTEMAVAMHNVREAIEEALLTVAAVGQADGFREKIVELFFNNIDDNSKDLELLFQQLVENGEVAGYLPIGKISLAPESGIRPEEYLGSLDYLKEMAGKYHYYDFANVPKSMEGTCRKKGSLADPFTKNVGDTASFSRQEDTQPATETGVDRQELVKFEKMCEELSEDANTIYGQFCAIGSLYRSAIGA